MSNIADFKIKLLKEKTNVIMDLQKMKQKVLNDITYLDKLRIIGISEQLDILIADIQTNYEMIENKG